MPVLPVLEYLQKQIAGELHDDDSTHMRYPTAISQTLEMRIMAVDYGEATVAIDADPEKHGNQQGTTHGGLICELADAAIGTAHSTLMSEGDSFATVEFKINFFRPVWKTTLRAIAKPRHCGKTLVYYQCDIIDSDDKLIATVSSTVINLHGEKAKGR